MRLTPFRALMLQCAAFLDGFRRDDVKSPPPAVPKRAGHREKSRQTPKRLKVWAAKFRATCRVWDRVKLPAGITTLRGKKPFTHLTRVCGVVYLVKHGTLYRLDKLVSAGQVSVAG